MTNTPAPVAVVSVRLSGSNIRAIELVAQALRDLELPSEIARAQVAVGRIEKGANRRYPNSYLCYGTIGVLIEIPEDQDGS